MLAAYSLYSAITPIHDINKKSYTEFLKNHFPEKKLIFKKEKKVNEKGFVLKGCFKPICQFVYTLP